MNAPATHETVDIAIEQSLLCALLLDPTAYDRAGKIDLLCFEDKAHRLIFKQIDELRENGTVPDIMAVAERLEARNELNEARGLAYIVGLGQMVASPANAHNYARILRERATSRSVAALGRRLTEAATTTREPHALLEQGREAFARIDTRYSPRGEKLPITSAADLKLSTNADYLIKNFLYRPIVGNIFGLPGDGKTAFALDIGCHVALGRPWRDRRVRQARVVFVPNESPMSIPPRVWGWFEQNDEDIAKAKLDIVNGAVKLNDSASVDSFIAQMKIDVHDPVGLIFFDTFAASTRGIDENSSADVGKVLGNLRRIAEETRAAVLFTHHSGKDTTRGPRGFSGITADVDLEVEISRGVAKVKKMRDGPGGAEFGFALKPVHLCVDDEGDDITAAVAVEADIASGDLTSDSKAKGLGKNQHEGMTAVLDCIREHGVNDAFDEQPKYRKVITRDAAIAAIAESIDQSKPSFRRKESANRALKSLIEKGLLREKDGYVIQP